MVSMVVATLQGHARCDRFRQRLMARAAANPAEKADKLRQSLAPCSLARSTATRPSRRASVAVRAEQPQQQAFAFSRREAGLAAFAAVAAFANVAPARAGLFGGGQKAEEEYQKKTVSQ
jgi:hypothetical protein